MEMHPYWHKQTLEKPLYPDIAWSKPEHRSRAGKLGIIGGNKLGFAGVAEGYSVAMQAGVGEVRVLLPDVLRKTIPTTITDTVFGATNPSGSLARNASAEMQALGGWADSILMIGDAGRNSETAILYEDFLQDYTGPLTITRDAVDLIKNSAATLVERPDTLLVVAFAQLQKLFQSVYYPKILTFSMQLTQLVEALHKFTVTYPVTIAVLHKDHIIVATGGEVTTTEWHNAMAIWRGSVATKAACYWLWNHARPLQATTASLFENT
jgi:NAD(P)H-hydrate repair Nnr-like enzyme with NAD(P)H-hydrate dehydratase domain